MTMGIDPLIVIARSVSDEAIQLLLTFAKAGLLRFARNDGSLARSPDVQLHI
jgi:hypothetical protein